jgi:hypothetical protein
MTGCGQSGPAWKEKPAHVYSCPWRSAPVLTRRHPDRRLFTRTHKKASEGMSCCERKLRYGTGRDGVGQDALVRASSLSPMKMAESYWALLRASCLHSRRKLSMVASARVRAEDAGAAASSYSSPFIFFFSLIRNRLPVHHTTVRSIYLQHCVPSCEVG